MRVPAPPWQTAVWVTVLVIVGLASGQCPSDTPDPVGEFTVSSAIGMPGGDNIQLSATGVTGTCLVAFWVKDTEIFEEHVDDSASLSAYNMSVASSIGIYPFFLYISNNDSMRYARASIQIEEQISDAENTDVKGVVYNDINFVNFGMTTGTNFCVFVDWSDNEVEETCYKNLTDLVPNKFGHVYGERGSYNVILIISNVHSAMVVKKLAWVDIKISDLIATAEANIVEYPPGIGRIRLETTLSTSVRILTRVNCSLTNSIDDTLLGHGYDDLIYSNSSSAELREEYNMTIQFPSPGYYLINMNCSNPVSYMDYTTAPSLMLDFEAVVPVIGFEVTSSMPQFPYVFAEEDITFTASVKEGSNVSVEWDFGDGTPPEPWAPFGSLNASSTPLDQIYQYAKSGTLLLIVKFKNSLAVKVWSQNVMAMYGITELTLVTASVSLISADYAPAPLSNAASPPDNITCDFTFADSKTAQKTLQTTGLSEPISPALLTVTHTYDPTFLGPISTSVTCHNALTNKTAVVAGELREAISGLAVAITKDVWIVEVGSEAVMTVSITAGTNVTLNVTCKVDAAPDVISYYPLVGGVQLAEVICSYWSAGEYRVLIAADNLVSNESTTMGIKAMVSVRDLIFTTNSPVPYEGNSASLSLNLSVPGPPYASHTWVVIDFDGDGMDDTDNLNTSVMSTGAMSLHTFNYNAIHLDAYKVSVRIWNGISTLTKVEEVMVIERLAGLFLSTEYPLLPAKPVAAVFNIMLNAGSHVLFNISYGDGLSETLTPTRTRVGGFSYEMTHMYNSSGNTTVTLKAQNPLEQNLEINETFQVRWPIVLSDLEFIHNDSVISQNGLISLTINHNGSPNVPPFVNILVIFPDNTILVAPIVAGWPKNVELNYTGMNTFDDVTTIVRLNNRASEVEKSIKFRFIEAIENQTISGPLILLEGVEGSFTMNVMMGSDISIDVDPGDGTSPTLVKVQGLSAEYKHVYSTYGVYPITANFSNNAGSFSKVFTVDVREQVNVSVIKNARVQLPDPFKLSFILPNSRLDGVLNFTIDFGDGTIEEQIDLEISTGMYNISHKYPVGSFQLTVIVDNFLSNQTITDLIHVDVPISGLNFSVFSWLNDTDDEFGILFEPSTPIYFQSWFTGGTRVNLSFVVDYEGGLHFEGSRFNYSFPKIGFINVTAIATNFADVQNITVLLTVISPVGLVSYTQPDDIYLIDNLEINITFDFPKNLCLHFFYEGSKNLELWYETKTGLCSERDPFYVDGMEVHQLENVTEFNLFPLFKAHGEYIETLLIYTEDNSQKKTYELIVHEYACENPTITPPEKPGKYIDDPIISPSSNFLEITSEDMDASTDCRETSDFITQWKLFKITRNDSEGIAITNNPKVDTTKRVYMYWDERALMPGLYRVQFTILMEKFEQFNNSNNIFVRIVPSPLHVAIYPDIHWQVGNVMNITVDAERETYDPDDLEDMPENEKIPIDYSWFCWQHDEMLTVPNDTASDGGFAIIAVPNRDDPVEEGLGGCFGSGPGKLNMVGGSFMIDPKHMAPDVYVIVVRASKTGRVAMAKQILTVVNGNPVMVLIQRDMTEECPSRFNGPGELIFYTACLSCEENPTNSDQSISTEYEWVVKDENGVSVDLGDSKTVISKGGGSSSQLTLVSAPLLPGTRYMLELITRTTHKDYTEGISTVELRTSTPPINGHCSITPKSGTFLTDQFTIVCEGWEDDDIPPGVFDGITTTITATSRGVTSVIASSRAFMPVGDPDDDFSVNVTMHVTDPCGSSTSVTQVIQVLPAGFQTAESRPDKSKSGDSQPGGSRPGGSESGGSPSGGSKDAGSKKDQSQADFALRFLKNLDTVGITLTSSTIATAAISIAASVDTADPTNAELQLSLFDTFGSLLLVGMAYPQGALLTMTDTVARLGKTLRATSIDTSVDTMYAITNSLRTDLKQQRKTKNVKHMAHGLTEIAVSCISVDAAVQAEKDNVDVSDDGLPSLLEEAPPEDQHKAETLGEAKKKGKAKQLGELQDAVKATALELARSSGHDISIGTDAFKVAVSGMPSDKITSSTLHISGAKSSATRISSNLCPGRVMFDQTYSSRPVNNYGKSAKKVNGKEVSTGLFGIQCSNNRTMRRKRATGGRFRRSTKDEVLNYIDFHGLMNIELSMNDEDRLEINMTDSPVDVNTSMIYFTLPIKDDTDGFVLDFELIPELYAGETLQVFTILKAKKEYLYKPRQNMYDRKAALPRNTTVNPWSFVVPENVNKAPLAFIGVLYINASYTGKAEDDDVGTNNATSSKKVIVPDNMILKNVSDFPFRVFTTFSTCRVWDSKEEEWVQGPCSLSKETTTVFTRCSCTTLTERMNSVSTGFTPPGINTIDFSKVFGNFGALLAENPAVFVIIVSTIVLWFLLLIWARRADNKDLMNWSIEPLVDNRTRDTYVYYITVVTGMRQGGGTKSNVAFVLSGENCDTGVRTMDDRYHRGFARGTIRRFTLRTAQPLGQLTYFRVWHDNSGKGSTASWHLDSIVVEDQQTRQSCHFLCDRWLAVEEEDGQIDRVLPVAGAEQILDTKNLFFISSRKEFTNEHLWVSVFARPECSNFTRTQRLTSGVTLLFITMVSNAMWYRTPDQAEDDKMIRLGPIVLSLDILYISVMSSLTSIPLSTLIILFFQKARPKPLKPGQTPTGMEPPSAINTPKENLSDDEAIEVKKYKRKYPLPWWCTIIAWVLSVLTILASGFFVILYSLDWGKEKAEGWLSAFFLCFFENLFIIQPFKVVIIALLLSCIFKKLDEEDEKKSHGVADDSKDDEEADFGEEAPTMGPPLSKKALEHARFNALRDKVMWQTLKEITLYVVFLFLVMYLAWGGRDNSDFLIRRSVLGMLNSRASADFMSIDKVSDGHKMWRWLEETLVPNMYWQQYYNGQRTPRWARRYTNDVNAVRLGTVRLRQLRVEQDRCAPNVPSFNCRPEYGFFASDSRDFTVGWIQILNRTDNLKSRIEKSYTFSSFLKLQNIPYLGVVNMYGGGGYVAELGNNSASALRLIRMLKKYDWVDKRTRAILFETTIYNVNVHLFASIICLFEFPAIGAVLPRISIDTFHAYAGVGIKGQVTIGLMATFCVILIYLMVHEGLKFKTEKRHYFKEPWNVLEVAFLCMSFTCVGMYSSKEAYSRYITDKVHDDKDANIGYMQLSTYEIGYNAIVGMTNFIATFKMLRILNFSKQVRDLATSLRIVRKDLLSFAIVFLCIYMAFSMFGMVLFGRYMYNYSTWVRSLESLYSTLLGKFDYNGLHAAHELVGPLFLIVYALIIVFVLVNLFIGIVTAAFEEARFDLACAFDNEVWAHLWYKLKVFLHLETPNKPEPLEEDESDGHDDDDRSEDDYTPGGIPDAMKPARRAALHSLDIHLHFLNIYIDQILKKENDERDPLLRTSKSNAAAAPPHGLDIHTALMWDDIPISLLEMLVKSPMTFGKKQMMTDKVTKSPSPGCSKDGADLAEVNEVLSEMHGNNDEEDEGLTGDKDQGKSDVDEGLQQLEDEIAAIAEEKEMDENDVQALEDEIAALADQGESQEESKMTDDNQEVNSEEVDDQQENLKGEDQEKINVEDEAKQESDVKAEGQEVSANENNEGNDDNDQPKDEKISTDQVALDEGKDSDMAEEK